MHTHTHTQVHTAVHASMCGHTRVTLVLTPGSLPAFCPTVSLHLTSFLLEPWRPNSQRHHSHPDDAFISHALQTTLHPQKETCSCLAQLLGGGQRVPTGAAGRRAATERGSILASLSLYRELQPQLGSQMSLGQEPHSASQAAPTGSR